MERTMGARDTEYQTMRRLLRLSEEENQTAALIAAALREELTARQTEMVQLYYLEQHSMQEVGRLLGVNPSTVSRTLKSAREKLRRCLRYGSRALLRRDE